MANVFGGSEIIEIGIQIEKNGKDFYSALIEKSKTPKAKDLFKFLAGEEEKHITTFKSMLGSVQKYEPLEAFSAEYLAYLNALASDYVFTKKGAGEKQAKRVKNEKEALALGIGFEKDSIIFYAEIKKMVSLDDQYMIDALIAQEQDHLVKLINLKKSL